MNADVAKRALPGFKTQKNLSATMEQSKNNWPHRAMPKLRGGSSTSAVLPRCFLIALSIICCFALVNFRLEQSAASPPSERTKNKSNAAAEIATALKAQQGLNSATGSLFHGTQIRTYTGPRTFGVWHQTKKESRPPPTPPSMGMVLQTCKHWAVVTTIFEPSSAVKRAASLRDWCIVIVADKKTPLDYMEGMGLKEGQHNTSSAVHFLSIPDQEKWAMREERSAVGKFLKAIPYNHFARKNIGYLYALMHGAEVIFDFDDDNLLADDVMSPLADETNLEGARVVMTGRNVFNHHMLMGATAKTSWPRGFPLELIQDQTTLGAIAYESASAPLANVGVMQFCANGNPDIDAVHRLVVPLPMDFGETTPLLVPSHTFVPYNAQATLHTKKSFWALFLPFTVPGRVSDIWRSYFAQALFRDLDLQIAILPAQVTQERNEHNYLGDMDAELDLYFKAGKLIDFLSSWTSKSSNIPERMEQLWIDLYERDYIDLNDVHVAQLWLKALIEIGYEFPKITRKRFDNVVMMGQFNYASKVPDVIFWAQKWRRRFQHVVVWGPFDKDALQQLRDHGVAANRGREDKGFSSPYENLMKTLTQFRNDSRVNGVLYAHDDALLNVNHDDLRPYLESGQDVLVNTGISFAAARKWPNDTNPCNLFYLLEDGTIQNLDGIPKTRDQQFQGCWAGWHNKHGWPTCFGSSSDDGYVGMLKDPRIKQYLEADGKFFVPGNGQTDFMFIPKKHVLEFEQAAQLMADHKLSLECAGAKLVDILARLANATVQPVSLCTEWDPQYRGSLKMIDDCGARKYAMYHPFKLSGGYQRWSETFDSIDGLGLVDFD